MRKKDAETGYDVNVWSVFFLCGNDHQQSDMYGYLSPAVRVRADCPLRQTKHGGSGTEETVTPLRDHVCQNRPSVDSTREVVRAQLPQMLSSIPSERLLMEEIDYSMLFRWFVGMNLDEPVRDVTVFSKNRNRLPEGDVAREFLSEVVQQAQSKGLTSDGILRWTAR
jgi:hypothetical protein